MSDDIKERIAKVEEVASSAHKRLDDNLVEIKGLREAKHDLYGKLHSHAGILVGMETAVKGLTDTVKEWADKTDENTQTQIKNRTTVVVALSIVGSLGTGFAGFVVWAISKFLGL